MRGIQCDSADGEMSVILVLRLYALYNHSRRSAHVAGFAFGVQVLYLTIFTASTLPKTLSFSMSSPIPPLALSANRSSSKRKCGEWIDIL